MLFEGKRLLICDCGGTMPLQEAQLEQALTALGGEGKLQAGTQLCRTQLERFQTAVAGDKPVLVGCTQETPLFEEIHLEDQSVPETGKEAAFFQESVKYFSIREAAGWSREASKAGPKMAALIAEAALSLLPADSVTLTCEGTILVYGRDEQAFVAAEKLSESLDVTLLLLPGESIIPPRVMKMPVFCGQIVAARGSFGAFEITVDHYAPSLPASRGFLEFEPPRDGAASRCDLVLDMTGDPAPLTAPEKRDGWFSVDSQDFAGVERALAELAQLTGSFEKPRYINYRSTLCTHSRNEQIGCTRCLDVCPAGAISHAGDQVAFDPYICGGCGHCASVCPTGAAQYQLPAGDGLYQRLRTLLTSYVDADGPRRAGPPILLIHDARNGADQVAMMARFGRGLPAHVIPFALHEVTQIGADFMIAALAYGAAAIRILIPPARRNELDGLASQVGLTATMLIGLGYDGPRIAVIDEADPEIFESILWSLPTFQSPEFQPIIPGRFLPMGGRRPVTMLALRHLHEHAPEPIDLLPLADGASFGTVQVNQEACTLCLACVATCPTGALLDNAERPQIMFMEEACVQCGLCRVTCPESAITLEPRVNFTAQARTAIVKHEEEPFHCVRCGKPFGTRGVIEIIIDKLAGKHWMFTQTQTAERIMMCDDCRVIAQFEGGAEPMAGAPRPLPRTTEDDLRERERMQARKAAGFDTPETL